MMLVRPAADEEGDAAGGHALGRHGGKRAIHLQLAHMVGQALDRLLQPGGFRHIAEQAIDRGNADGGQHGPPVGIGQR